MSDDDVSGKGVPPDSLHKRGQWVSLLAAIVTMGRTCLPFVTLQPG